MFFDPICQDGHVMPSRFRYGSIHCLLIPVVLEVPRAVERGWSEKLFHVRALPLGDLDIVNVLEVVDYPPFFESSLDCCSGSVRVWLKGLSRFLI